MSLLSTSLLAALLVGLGGGAHCALMCGGISSAMLAGRQHTRTGMILVPAQLGRIASYMLAGVLVASLGAELIARLATRQSGTVIATLLGLAWVAISFHLLGWRLGGALFARVTTAFWRRLQPLTRRVWPINSVGRAFAAGALWGWLPCGMSYAMLAVAAATADPWHAAALMFAFGIGTMPGTLLPALAAARLQRIALLSRFRPVLAWSTLAMGLLIGVSPWLSGHQHHHGPHAAQASADPAGEHRHH